MVHPSTHRPGCLASKGNSGTIKTKEMAQCQFPQIDLKAVAFATLNDLKQIFDLVDCNNVATEMT